MIYLESIKVNKKNSLLKEEAWKINLDKKTDMLKE